MEFLYLGNTPLPIVKMFPSSTVSLSIDTFNVSMRCIPGDRRFKYSYTWEKQNDILPLRANGINSRHLTIYNVRTEDAGMYRCKLSNFTGKIASDYSMLIVKGNSYDG